MTKLYRTVPVKDEDGVKGRLPEKQRQWYTCFANNDLSKSYHKYFINGNFIFGIDTIGEYTHWLEEVEMPSDDIINKEFSINFSSDVYSKEDDIKRFGAKWMRDLIFNTTTK